MGREAIQSLGGFCLPWILVFAGPFASPLCKHTALESARSGQITDVQQFFKHKHCWVTLFDFQSNEMVGFLNFIQLYVTFGGEDLLTSPFSFNEFFSWLPLQVY